MLRFVLLLVLAADVQAAAGAVDIDSAAGVYQDAAVREQVRASLGTMPQQIRRLFEGDSQAKLTTEQLAAVTAAAKRGFRIDVFEAPALSVFASNLDPATVKKTEAFLSSELGKRMVAADVAVSNMDQADIDKVMNGDITVATTPQRDAILDRLERASRTTESAVEIFLSMGTAVAVGTAVGSGTDPGPVQERSQKAGEESRAALEESMRKPLRRYMAYGYRDLSDSDLKHVVSFMESPAGKRYVSAYIASMNAGFDAMGRRCGEQLGESFRELAQAQLATTQREDPLPPDIAKPDNLKPAPRH
jgi:Uncharacterized protein conserved in bacteria (DUF2059)